MQKEAYESEQKRWDVERDLREREQLIRDECKGRENRLHKIIIDREQELERESRLRMEGELRFVQREQELESEYQARLQEETRKRAETSADSSGTIELQPVSNSSDPFVTVSAMNHIVSSLVSGMLSNSGPRPFGSNTLSGNNIITSDHHMKVHRVAMFLLVV
jgi:hypothetical protein